MAENDQAQPQPQEQPQVQFAIQRIYVKDISFEAPSSPTIFTGEWKPENQMNLNTKVDKVAEDTYEVILSVTLTTKVGEQTAFIVEVQQAGIFVIKGAEENQLAPILFVECPNTLFPYVRELVTDLTTKGSFPQLVLQPVNFLAVFMQHQQQMQEQAGKAQATGQTAH